MRLRPTQAVVIGVVALALAVMGIPSLLPIQAGGSIRGVVLDARGFGIPGTPVFLFSETRERLVEESRTDANGNFAFHLEAEAPRLLVRPRATEEWVPAWSRRTARPEELQVFVLEPARPLEVRVRNRVGAPVPEAEVRIYAGPSDPAVVAHGRTDATGTVRLTSGPFVHVVAFAPGPARLARWRFDLVVPRSGGEVLLTLPDAVLVHGRVVGPDGPLAGILLSAWEDGLEGGWNGFAESGADGAFELPRTTGPTELRAVDPSGRYLPVRVGLGGPSESVPELVLSEAAPQVVRTTSAGRPVHARIWSWSPAEEAWAFGRDTDAAGRAVVPVGERFGLHAEPLDAPGESIEAWDVAREEGVVVLEVRTER